MVHLTLPEASLISELSRSSDLLEWKPAHLVAFAIAGFP